MRRFARSCSPPTAPATCACASGCRARTAPTSIAAARNCAASGSPKAPTASIALSGARDGDVGRALLQGNAARARSARRARGPARFPQRYYLEVQRAGARDDDALVAATVALAASSRCRWSPRIRCSSSRAEDFRAHEARVCIAEGHVLVRHAPAAALHRRAALHDAGRDGRSASPTCPEALANTVAIAQRCNLDDPARQEPPARVSHARRRDDRRAPAQRGGGRARAASRAAVSRRGAARAEAARVRRAARLRDGAPSCRWASPATSSSWPTSSTGRAATSVPVGPGRGSGAGSLVAYSLGITDLDPLRYALHLRALPQSRAGVDARLRHRLLPGRPRSRHRLRQGEVRRRLGVADRHLRHAGRQGRGARRRSRARPALPVRRRHRQAHSVPAGQARDAEAARAASPRPTSSTRARPSRSRRARERRRRKCASCSRSPSSSRACRATSACTRAACSSRRASSPTSARSTCSRAPTSMVSQFDKDDVEAVGLVKFDFLGLTTLTILDWTLRYVRMLDPSCDDRPRHAAARRPERVLDLPHRQHHRRVPVRIARHARAAEAGAGRPLRGHHRAGRAVPARADGAHPRLRRAQVRPRARGVSRTRASSRSCRRPTA